MAHTMEGKGLKGLSTTGRSVVNSIYADSDGAALQDLIQVCLSEGLKTLEMPASTFTATLAPRGYSEWSLAEVCAAFDLNHQDKVSLRRLMLEEMVASVSLTELNFDSAELYNSWLEKRISQVFALYDVEDRGELSVPQFCLLAFDMVQAQGGNEDFYTIEKIVQSMTNEITVSYEMFSEAVMLNVFGEFGIDIELLSRSRSVPSRPAPATSTSADSGGEVPSFRVQWNSRQVESSPEVHLGRMVSSDISPTAMAPLTYGFSTSLTAIRSAVSTNHPVGSELLVLVPSFPGAARHTLLFSWQRHTPSFPWQSTTFPRSAAHASSLAARAHASSWQRHTPLSLAAGTRLFLAAHASSWQRCTRPYLAAGRHTPLSWQRGTRLFLAARHTPLPAAAHHASFLAAAHAILGSAAHASSWQRGTRLFLAARHTPLPGSAAHASLAQRSLHSNPIPPS
ncbi:hypothetical protein CYMTET_27409 [Cymbomonas tetramitiformis]|uniref:EF-hand domain-containing protein n=1 Tax=Cymbomonas tetramitiformis TaxID=36881 RepID=A0AAE0FPU9_9CHLO|nr:hypothetical protein CYMTET_27409 [Cymbomonas tetramitiformis]